MVLSALARRMALSFENAFSIDGMEGSCLCFGPLIAGSCQPQFRAVIAGVMVLSEVERLMMMFGSGASTCATTFQWTSAETTRSPQPPSRRGHRECRDWRP